MSPALHLIDDYWQFPVEAAPQAAFNRLMNLASRFEAPCTFGSIQPVHRKIRATR